MTGCHTMVGARHARKRPAPTSALRATWRRARRARHVTSSSARHHRYPWAVVVAGGILVASTGTAWGYFTAASTTHTYALAEADPLAAPTAVTATEVSATSVDIDWTDPPEPSGTHYEVVRDPATTAVIACTDVTTGPCLDSGLAAGTTYTYGVFAYLGTKWRSPMAMVTYTTPAMSAPAAASS